MTLPLPRKDLVVLVADQDQEFALRGLLSRPPALGIRPITADIQRHLGRDAGCLTQGHSFLRPFTGQYDHALVVFDWEGSGGERRGPREILEAEVEARLAAAGWDDRARAVALQPEVEIWVWSDSPEVDRILGWQDHTPALRPWLAQRQFLPAGAAKPPRPKEALAAALREVRQVPSANLFRQLGANVGLGRCTDSAFAKLRAILQAWFPV